VIRSLVSKLISPALGAVAQISQKRINWLRNLLISLMFIHTYSIEDINSMLISIALIRNMVLF
jgi:hypothetical protein